MADLVASFTQYGNSTAFSAGGTSGLRSIFQVSTSGIVTGSVFSGRNIYLFVGNGTSFANSTEFLVVKTAQLFDPAQDSQPTALTFTTRPATSTLLCGTFVPNVKTTNNDTSITPGWGMGPSLLPSFAVTGVASDITATSASLNGMVTTYGVPTTAQFEYGLTTSYGSTAAGVILAPDNGWSEQAVSASINGLQSGQIYHFRLTATNNVRTDVGADMMFVTGNVLTTTAQHGMVAGAGDYPHGSTATLTATPDPGYLFTGWSGDATGTANPLSVLMDADKTIGATFTRQYTLTTSTLSNGSITGIAADGKYLTDTTATLTAVPAADYAFTGWTGAASGTTNPLSLLMDADKTIGATFTRQYTLSASAVSNGTISGIAAGGKYLTGTTATLTAVPAAGYAFTGWTGDATGTTNPLSLVMDADKTIGATFTWQYTLTTSTLSHGSITGIAAGGKYLTGTTATLTAVPAAGYMFTGWTGAASGTTNPFSLLMDGDKTIGANFTRQYTLTSSAVSNGTISGIAVDGKYLTGSTATLTAVPAAGYAFTGWTGAANGTVNPLSLLMDADKTIGANFTRQYTLTSGTTTNGTINGIIAGGKYLTGTTAELTAVPSPGYAFTGWTGAANGT
ncbi:MAG: InlB B-repeat-containing protein, partial [Verrucomicrobia bacterium]|nr:InlB B-repeat-containing protein [Verrucomicrobiota bacterium]